MVATVYADEGPTAKRIRPRAQGRAFRIRKRTSHITVIVESRPAKDAAVGRPVDRGRVAPQGSKAAAQGAGKGTEKATAEKAPAKKAPAQEGARQEGGCQEGSGQEGAAKKTAEGF